MRYGLAYAALLLPLAGCVVPAPAPYYPQPAYVQPGYAAPYPQADYAYPGYAYNNGSPTLAVEGVTWPLIFYGGGWGYWDGYHRWHGAPGGIAFNLNRLHPGGVGYRPFGGGQFGRPGGFGGGGGFRGGAPGGGVRPAAVGRPAAAPARGGGGREEHR
jgi:hypothetical protein